MIRLEDIDPAERELELTVGKLFMPNGGAHVVPPGQHQSEPTQ